MKVLLLQKMDPAGMKILEDAGLQVDIPGDTSEEGLCACAAEYDAIIVRGMVKLPASVIHRARKCRIISFYTAPAWRPSTWRPPRRSTSLWRTRPAPMPTQWRSRRSA